MKKLLVLLVAVLMALTLAGCGEKEEPTPAATASITDAKTIADLSGMKIAAQAGTFHADALSQIEGVKSSTLPDFTDLLIALQAKTIDGYVAEEPTAISVCQSQEGLTYLPFVNNQTGFTATEEDTGIAVGLKKGSDLTAQMNTVLEAVTVDVQRELMSQIITLVNGGSVDSFVLESEVPANPTGVLKVGMECAYEPYNWTDAPGTSTTGAVTIYDSNGNATALTANGFDVQVAQYIANKLGLELQVYAIEWDSLIPAVQSGVVDAIIAGMSPTAERAQEVDFTNCHYNSNLVVIINK